MLSIQQKIIKRIFDIFVSFSILLIISFPLFIVWLIASIDTQSNGFFFQERIGLKGKSFKVIKIKSMRPSNKVHTTVTTKNDSRITKTGSIWRQFKIDELPQLINVLIGDMSIVGPRPDVPGFADLLEGEDKVILDIRPGITSPASIKYKNEESTLANQSDPERYNREVIYPDKVKINKDYIKRYSFLKDLRIILKTIGL